MIDQVVNSPNFGCALMQPQLLNKELTNLVKKPSSLTSLSQQSLLTNSATLTTVQLQPHLNGVSIEPKEALSYVINLRSSFDLPEDAACIESAALTQYNQTTSNSMSTCAVQYNSLNQDLL